MEPVAWALAPFSSKWLADCGVEEGERIMTLERSRGGYVIVLEWTRTGYRAYVPDLPGCAAMSRTMDQTRRRMDEAILIHQEGMRQEGLQVPRPKFLAELRRKRLL
jgi:predicted RNase H-like HicB family nuclease